MQAAIVCPMRKMTLALVPVLAAWSMACGGGSTGDPGVTDWISLDDPAQAPVGPRGACESLQRTARVADVTGRPARLREISAGEGLWFDTVRGIVVDVSVPDAMRVRGKLELGE